MCDVRYCNFAVNVKDGEIEMTDPDLKRAQLVKVTLESVAVAMTVVLYLQMILDDATIDRLRSDDSRSSVTKCLVLPR